MDPQALMDKSASRIIMAPPPKCHRFCYGRYFEKNSFSFHNGFAMEAPDTANTNNGHWKMLVTVIFLHLWILFSRIQQEYPKINLFFWQNPWPSSVRYCLPIPKQFKKETAELAKKKHQLLKNE